MSMSFVVLLRDRGRSATSFLLQALAVADTLVLLSAVPLYVAPSVYPFTGLLAGYYNTYMSLMPVLWPIFLRTRSPPAHNHGASRTTSKPDENWNSIPLNAYPF